MQESGFHIELSDESKSEIRAVPSGRKFEIPNPESRISYLKSDISNLKFQKWAQQMSTLIPPYYF